VGSHPVGGSPRGVAPPIYLYKLDQLVENSSESGVPRGEHRGTRPWRTWSCSTCWRRPADAVTEPRPGRYGDGWSARPIADPDDPGLRRLDMGQSFILLRGTARTSNRRLSELRAVILPAAAYR
jgi:hypothetical protein